MDFGAAHPQGVAHRLGLRGIDGVKDHPPLTGAQAAAQRYFNKNASQLSNAEAARLAVMLPAPKRFEKQPQSAYHNGRTRVIKGRMGRSELP